MKIKKTKKLEELWKEQSHLKQDHTPLAVKVNNNLYPLSYDVEEQS